MKGEAFDRSGLIYGLGHAVYTLSDPRAVLLKGMAKKLAEDQGLIDDFMLYDFIEKQGPKLYQEIKGVEKPMPANVDLYSGFVYSALNIPLDISTPVFATSRYPDGVHRIKSWSQGQIVRPAYKRPASKQYVPSQTVRKLKQDKQINEGSTKELQKPQKRRGFHGRNKVMQKQSKNQTNRHITEIKAERTVPP